MKRVSGKSEVLAGKNASGGKLMKLYAGGKVSKSVHTSSVGSVSVVAWKPRCNTHSYMNLRINGKKVRTWRVREEAPHTYRTNIRLVQSGPNTFTIGHSLGKRQGCTGAIRIDRVSLAPLAEAGSGVSEGINEPPSPPSTETTKPTCDTSSLQSRIDATPSGGTLTLTESCIYRESVRVTKPMTLDGGGIAEIRGSDVWSDWSQSGSRWVSDKSIPTFDPGRDTTCEADTSRCRWPAQVFVDGAPLVQVASAPAAGQFAVGSENRIVLGASPTGRVVEVSVRGQWLTGAADNVTVRGFTMKHASNRREVGALTNQNMAGNNFHHNWTLENNRLSDAHAAVVRINGRNTRLLNNDISRGGQLGVHGGGSGALLLGNKIHNNNTESFNMGWESGGVKFAFHVTDLTVRDNHFYDNQGVGFWCDLYCSNVTVESNRMSGNWGPGIHYEVSSAGTIRDNAVWNNGWKFKQPRSWSPGIVISCSTDTKVSQNTLAWNASAISVIHWDRPDGKCAPTQNVHVENNFMAAKDGLSLSWMQESAGGSKAPASMESSNNYGSSNEYWYPTAENGSSRFRWISSDIGKLSVFNGTQGENNGSYASDARKNVVLGEEGIPSSF